MRCLSLLLFTVLAPLVGGQTITVDPVERHLVLTDGKSAKVTIDTGDCDPTWTASSDDEDVATVSPEAGNASSKRTFTVKANQQGDATITITADGAGTDCLDEEEIVITVVVVMDTKAVVKFFKKGLKSPLKTLKTNNKASLSDAKSALDAILKSLQNETIGVEGPGGLSHAAMVDMALQQGADACDDAFQEIFDNYTSAVMNMKSAGESTALLYGFGFYLDSLPPGFFEGGCGEWDDATKAGWALFVDTVDKLNGLAKKFDEGVTKEAAATTGIAISSSPDDAGEFTTGGIDITSTEKIGEFKDDDPKTLKQKKPKAWNSVSEDGSANNGRIRAKGKANPADGNVTVTYERLGSDGEPVGTDEGDYFEDTDVMVGSDCRYRSYAPAAGDTPNLNMGRWRVTVTQGSGGSEQTKIREIQIRRPSSD